jgi:segregation and condensation protein B
MNEEKSQMNEIEGVDILTDSGKIAFIESVLFVSKDPVEPERFISYLNIGDVREFERLLLKMEENYRERDSGIMLKRAGGGLQLTTKAFMHDYLKDFFTIKSSSRLSVASLETLAIVAYRQPVTIAEISDLRGVNSVGPIKNLLQKKLVRITGRKKVPGLPALYSTTKEFLVYFGLRDLSELPSLEELTEMFEEKEQPSLFQ